MGRKKDTTIDPDLVPVWFELPQGFYKKLKAISDECGLGRKEAIQTGLKLLLREHRKRIAGQNAKESAKKPGPAALGAQRWVNVDRSERTRIAREMALKRWAKRRSG